MNKAKWIASKGVCGKGNGHKEGRKEGIKADNGGREANPPVSILLHSSF